MDDGDVEGGTARIELGDDFARGRVAFAGRVAARHEREGSVVPRRGTEGSARRIGPRITLTRRRSRKGPAQDLKVAHRLGAGPGLRLDHPVAEAGEETACRLRVAPGPAPRQEHLQGPSRRERREQRPLHAGQVVEAVDGDPLPHPGDRAAGYARGRRRVQRSVVEEPCLVEAQRVRGEQVVEGAKRGARRLRGEARLDAGLPQVGQAAEQSGGQARRVSDRREMPPRVALGDETPHQARGREGRQPPAAGRAQGRSPQTAGHLVHREELDGGMGPAELGQAPPEVGARGPGPADDRHGAQRVARARLGERARERLLELGPQTQVQHRGGGIRRRVRMARHWAEGTTGSGR